MRIRTAGRLVARKTVTVAFALALCVLPALTASAGLWRSRRNDAPPASPQSGTTVYRPAFPVLRTKPLYLSSYAGVTYPPLTPRASLDPTMTRRRPLVRWFSGEPIAP